MSALLEIHEVRRQRDELLAALKGMVEVFGDEFGMGDSETVDRARAEISNVEAYKRDKERQQ